MTAFGRPEHTDSRRFYELIAESLPPSLLEDDEAPSLERCLQDAGFGGELAEYRRNPERYPDLETLVPGLLAVGPLRRVVRTLGDEQIADYVRQTYTPYVRSGGSVSIADEYRLRIARP